MLSVTCPGCLSSGTCKNLAPSPHSSLYSRVINVSQNPKVFFSHCTYFGDSFGSIRLSFRDVFEDPEVVGERL